VHHLAVLSSEPLRAKVGAAAAARVQRHYTVDRMSARFEALLAEMTASAALAPRCSAQQAGGARVSLGRRLIRLRGVRDTLRAICPLFTLGALHGAQLAEITFERDFWFLI
jgi:hypothetical protein